MKYIVMALFLGCFYPASAKALTFGNSLRCSGIVSTNLVNVMRCVDQFSICYIVSGMRGVSTSCVLVHKPDVDSPPAASKEDKKKRISPQGMD